MQRVSAFLPSWDKRTSSNTNNTSTSSLGANSNPSANPPSHTARAASAGTGFFGWSNRSSASSSRASVFNNLSKINVNQANRRVSNTASLVNASGRVQREAFWPATLDHECDKSARIIKSFCGMSPSSPTRLRTLLTACS